MPSLYNCRHDGDQYRITKFDSDFNVEASYLCTLSACECPAGHRSSCRHRQMLPKFVQRGHIGDEWFWDHDRGGWVQGTGVEIEEPAEPSVPFNLTATKVAEREAALAVPSPDFTPQLDAMLKIAEVTPSPSLTIRRRV